MCRSKVVHYHACRHTKVVPINCSQAPLVRKLYQFIDGEQMDFAGVDPCADWSMNRTRSGVEEVIGECNACKEARGTLPVRIG